MCNGVIRKIRRCVFSNKTNLRNVWKIIAKLKALIRNSLTVGYGKEMKSPIIDAKKCLLGAPHRGEAFMHFSVDREETDSLRWIVKRKKECSREYIVAARL